MDGQTGQDSRLQQPTFRTFGPAKKRGMKPVQYRIATVTFEEEPKPTWGTRALQIVRELARWGRGGWRLSRLNASAHIRVHARGFCVLLERPLAWKDSESSRRIQAVRRSGFAA